MVMDKGIALGQAIRDGLSIAPDPSVLIEAFAATPPLYPRDQLPLGIDVSFYQGAIDWDAAWKDGVRFAAIRGGQRHGLSGWTDSRFVENWKNAKRVGMLRMIYWVWDPASSGQQHFDGMRRAIDLVDGDMGELGGMPDVELAPVRWSDVELWLQKIDDFWGIPPLPYSGAWFLNQLQVPQFFRELDHFLTGYNNIGPDLPRDYTPDVVAWQQTSSWAVPWVQSATVDRDYWMELLLNLWRYADMTEKVVPVDALLEWLAQNQTECEEAPTPPPALDEYLVVVGGNFRTSPGVQSSPPNLIRFINDGERVFDLGQRSEEWWFVRDANGVEGWFWEPGWKLQKV
jgi:GH25 family lysozyme M1 (1,4-beta-N-acetylmuramidase)